jgi:hypothetical protein
MSVTSESKLSKGCLGLSTIVADATIRTARHLLFAIGAPSRLSFNIHVVLPVVVLLATMLSGGAWKKSDLVNVVRY